MEKLYTQGESQGAQNGAHSHSTARNGQPTTGGAANHTGPVWDFLKATRDTPTFRRIRDDFPDFDLTDVAGVNMAARLLWNTRCEFDKDAVKQGKHLEELVEQTLRLLSESPDTREALEWLCDPRATVYPLSSQAQDVARRLVMGWRGVQCDIAAPSVRNERGALEYDARQLVEILYPHWKCAALSTHAAHEERMVEHIGDDIRFAENLGWMGFTGRNWKRDDRHATQTANRAKSLSQVVRDEGAALYAMAGELARAGRGADAEAMARAATSHTKHAKQAETKNFLEGALHFAAGEDRLRVTPDAFDQRPWLLGFENGVWDAGQWRGHRREDFLLHLCPVSFDAEVDRSEWESVLHCITGGDSDFARTLQDAAGYILSGASHLRFLPWLYGPKGTGKSTFAELLQTALGKMAATIDPKKLQDDAARERLGADLWNRRLAVCAEAGGQKLEAELLKTLSGSDTLTVRFLYQEAFDAIPRHVLLMVSNDAPKLDAYDDALKDRVFALPFVHRLDAGGPLELSGGARIEAVRKDPTSLLVRGFVAWALDGLARVHRTQSIFRAPCIESATAKFWADTDTLTPFWETLDELELRDGITKSDLRTRYERWCLAEGARPFNRQLWARACESRGLESYSTGKARGWRLTQLTQFGTFPESPHEAPNNFGRLSGKVPSCVSCVSDTAPLDDDAAGVEI